MFLFIEHLKRIFGYLDKITMPTLDYMKRMVDFLTIWVEIKDIQCPSKKEFAELIRINFLMILYLIVNQVNSCYSCMGNP